MKSLTTSSFCALVVLVGTAAPLYSAETLPTAARARPEPEQLVLVGGQVNIPSRYRFTNGITALKAIQMAKGFTKLASTTIEVRRGEAKPMILNRQHIEQGKQEDLKLQSGDIVFVPKK